jgi:hypothetical protein
VKVAVAPTSFVTIRLPVVPEKVVAAFTVGKGYPEVVKMKVPTSIVNPASDFPLKFTEKELVTVMVVMPDVTKQLRNSASSLALQFCASTFPAQKNKNAPTAKPRQFMELDTFMV